MAIRSRSVGRHAFLPSGMTAFLKRRAGQFLGFFMVCFSGLLAAILVTYHPSDPSWNLAIDGTAKNVMAYPGAVVADGLLQTFGVASIYWIVAFLGWGVRSMAAVPLRWIVFRVPALIIAILLAASVAAQWTAPKAWLLPNSLGGALGDILYQRSHELMGTSLLTVIAIGVVFSGLSFILLILSMGITLKQLGKGLFNFGASVNYCLQLVYRGLARLFFWGTRGISDKTPPDVTQIFMTKRKIITSGLTADKDDPEVDNALSPRIVSPHHADGALHVTPEDRENYAPPGEGEKSKTAIIWGNNINSTSSDDEDEDYESEDSPVDAGSAQSGRKPIKYSGSYDILSDFSTMGWEDYELPSLDLLDPSLRKTVQAIDPQLLEESAQHLKTVLEEFGVRGEVVTVRPGPVVTMYEFKPAAGIKTSRVIGLADDIARSMSALSARIAVIPGRNVIGIELPNSIRETVYLRELLQSETYEKTTSHLSLILGKDIGGQPVIADLTRMPHLLVAGTTGSGKSVAVNTMILSLLFRLSPDRCKFIMIDPKMLELSVYDGIPHLLSPVVTDPKKAIVALKWAVREMENRYRAMSKLGVRNIDGYNVRIKEARQSGEMLVRRVQTGFDPDSGKPIFENQQLDLESLPYIVVVVDEMADLMMVAGKEIEAAVQRLAQMARAAGIHLIMATQRPSVDVITGTIKANFPTRISFQVTSKIDSRTILGEQGAEQLLGQGDMLYMAGGGRITRVHGPFVRDDEVERIVSFLKAQAEPVYIDSITDEEGEFINFDEDGGRGGDTLYNQAVELVIREGRASTSFIQRHLQIGYNKAAGIMETMEKNGVVSSANHVGKREVLR
jgi:S-DNA-T family DNA segregation ATPase FtsK/SpoIIIE